MLDPLLFCGTSLHSHRCYLRKPAARRAFYAATLAGAFCAWLLQGLPAHAGSVDVAIVFAVDYSSSVDTRIAALQREGHAAALTSPEILSAISGNYFGCIGVTYFEWSSPGHARVVLPWKSICDFEDAKAASDVIRARGDTGYARRARSLTSISSAIDGASLLLDQFPGRATRKVIDISANGENNDGAPVEPSRLRAIAKGYTINAIATSTGTSNTTRSLASYFADEVIGGFDAFVIDRANTSDYLIALRRKLLAEISFNVWPRVLREN